MGKFAFSVQNTPVDRLSQEIRDDNAVNAIQATPAQQEPAPVQPSTPSESPAPVATCDTAATKGKKSANGIVISVPMDLYVQLTMLKLHTGRTLKELALQAISEFVERNRVE